MPDHFAIIGGGLLGQVMALRLAQRGQRVTLIEAADHLGGLADAWQLGDVTWDRHYHVTLLSDLHLRQLLSDLDLHDDLVFKQTRTGFYSGGNHHSLSSSLDFLRFPPMSLLQKARLAWTIHRASRIEDWRPLDEISVEAWLRIKSGDAVFEKIWLPLLKSKLGDAYRNTSAAFIWATINRMYAARKSGLKKEMFGYVRGGYHCVLARLRERLENAGVTMRTSSPVRQVRSQDDCVDVLLRGDDSIRCDRAVITTAPPLAAGMCPQLSSDEQQQWRDVPMLGVVCLSLLLKKPLEDYYVTNITDAGFPFTGVIEMTALVDSGEVGGHHLVYLPKYATSDDALFKRPEDEIFHDFFAGLVRMHPHLTQQDVITWRISRARHVMAIPEVRYASRVPAVTTGIRGVYLASSAQILNNTLNVNATIDWAQQCLQVIEQDQVNTKTTHGTLPQSSHHEQTAGQLVAGPR